MFEHLVRIALHGATERHYQDLHRKLAVFGVTPFATDRHGARERLPPGVYHHRGPLAPELLRTVVQGCIHLAAPVSAEVSVEALPPGAPPLRA